MCGYEHFANISKIVTLCFFVLQRDAEVDDAIAGFVQPQILIVGDIFDIDIIYIVAEGGIICQLPQKSILDALLGLLGSFYIFNVSYNQSKAILTFLEQALPNTAISLYRKRNWQIPNYRVENRRSTDTAFITGHAY